MPNTFHKLASAIRIVPDLQGVSQLLEATSPSALRRPTRIAFVNAHAANIADAYPAFLADLVASEFLLRDGVGMKMFMRWIKMDPGVNMNGTDLIPKILARYRSEPVALLGTESPHLERAGEALAGLGHIITLEAHGFHPDEWYVERVGSLRPTLIVLAMGMPKQERVAALLAARLGYPCLIVCGGAILDFMGGRVTRAPGFIRSLGLEWLYRLALEPRRLFGRYIFGTARFIIKGFQTRTLTKGQMG